MTRPAPIESCHCTKPGPGTHTTGPVAVAARCIGRHLQRAGRPLLALAVVLLLVPLVPTVEAGSRSDPDVVDPVGDVVDELTNRAVSGSGVDPVDIHSAWFELDDDRLQVVLRLHDLRPHTDTSAFRTTDTVHQWLVRWDLDGYRLAALMSYDALGNTFGGVSVEGDVGSGGPSTDQGGANAATLELDFDSDEVRLDLPAEFTLDLLEAGISHTFTHADGTTIANPWAQTFTSRGLMGGCLFPCPRMDETQIGPSFTLGENDNSFVIVRPLQPTTAVMPGQSTTVPLRVSASQGEGLQAHLRTTVDRQDWTVTVPNQVTVGAGAPVDVGLQVEAPVDAQGVAVVTVHGGRAPTQVVVVVTQMPAALDGLNSWAETQTLAGPLEDPLLRHGQTVYHLAGTPHNGNGIAGEETEHPVREAYLTSSPPLAVGAEISTSYEIDDDLVTLGAYTGPPLSSVSHITGEARLDLHASWSGLEGATVGALVGPAPLPVEGVQAEPPPGAFFLESEPLTADGDGVVQLKGHSNGTRLAAGDQVAVSLFVQGDDVSGSLTTHVFSQDRDSRLHLGVEHAVAPRLDLLAPGTRSLVIPGIGATSHAAQSAFVPVAIVGEDEIQPSRRDAVPVAVHLAAAEQDPERTYHGTLRAMPGENEATHRFEVSDQHHAVTLELAADHAMSHYNDNQVWVDLYRVHDDDARELVKSARGPGPEQTLRLLPHDIALSGRGTYEAVVRFYLAGAGLGSDADYALTITPHADAYVTDAATLLVHSFDEEALPPGPVRFELRDTSGATVDALELQHTAVGFTQRPTTEIRGPTRLQAGTTFTLDADAVDLDGRVTSYRWDLGDGSTAEGPRVEHRYAEAGTYQVVLEVRDDVGAAAVARHLVHATAEAVDATAADAVGTVGRYADAYEQGLAHLEDYTTDWLAREVAGHLGSDYLDTGAVQAYVQGTWPTAGRSVALDDGAVHIEGLPTGAAVRLRHDEVTVGLGGAQVQTGLPQEVLVDGVAVAVPDSDGTVAAGADQALVQVVAESTSGDGITARTEATQMIGTLHADHRLQVTAGVTQRLEATSQVRLPMDTSSWIAYPLANGTVQVVPAADVDTFSLGAGAEDPAPGWFATFDPDRAHVYGVVLAGDLHSVSVSPRAIDDELLLDLRWSASGGLGLAHYPIAYGVQDPGATRYAGVTELHRMERNELGIAVLDAERTAARAWHSSDARIELVELDRADGILDKLWAKGASWRFELEAPAEQGGKALRVVMDAKPVLEGAMRLQMDGQAMDPALVRSVTDERTLLVTLTIPSFSLHEVFIETVAPGVPPLFLWLTLVLAIVVVIETLVIGRMAKRRRDQRIRHGGSSPGAVATRRRAKPGSSRAASRVGATASASAPGRSSGGSAATRAASQRQRRDHPGPDTTTDAAEVAEGRAKRRKTDVDIVSILGAVLSGGRR